MSNTSDRPEAASDKRRAQARERQRKRGDLNRYYMEEEALRALDAGTLKRQEVRLLTSSVQILDHLADRLGSDRSTILNQAICYAAFHPKTGRGTIAELGRLGSEQVDVRHEAIEVIPFDPTAETIRTLLRAGHFDARSIYAWAGLELLAEGIRYASANERSILSRSPKVAS